MDDHIIKRWIIVRKPGCVPQTKCPPLQSDDGVIQMLKELVDDRPEGTSFTIAELTFDNQLWVNDGREILANF